LLHVGTERPAGLAVVFPGVAPEAGEPRGQGNDVPPALAYAKRDTRRELTTEEDLRYVLRATQDIVEELATLAQRKRDSEAAPESRDSDHAFEVMRVLAIPAHDGVDEVALHMLKNLLDAGSYEVSLASPGILASEVISLVSETEPALLCIAALPPGGGAPAVHAPARPLSGAQDPGRALGLYG
jgi:hypothetical protein